MKTHVEGLIAAPFTPMTADGSVNVERIDAYAHLLHRNGLVGVFVCGTTGEGMSLTPQERIEVAQRWVHVSPDGFKVIVHVGHNSIEICKVLAAHAQKIGAWGTAAIGPVFYKPRRIEELVAFCREVAAAAPELPFYYYHIPSMTGLDFAMADFLNAAAGRIPNLAGIKFSNEDLMDFGLCLEREGGRYDLLFGRDEMLLGALALGVRGAVGSTYNFAAPLYLRILKAFESGDLETARGLQQKSRELVQHLVHVAPAFLPAAKAVMEMVGVDCGPVRLPLRNLPQEQRTALRSELEKIGFFEYCSK